MIMQLLNMYKHIVKPNEDGYRYMSEAMTNFHLLPAKEKIQICYQLMTFPDKTREGAKVVDYLIMASEYRRDFPTWAHNKGIYIRYAILKNEVDRRKTI